MEKMEFIPVFCKGYIYIGRQAMSDLMRFPKLNLRCAMQDHFVANS